MISDSQYDALLEDLYAGTGSPERMSAFMRALGDLTGSHVTTFLREDFANPSASTFLTTGAEPNEILSYEGFGGENPWVQRTQAIVRSGAVLDGDEYVSTRELKSSLYYNDFLRHMDIQHSVGICASLEQHRTVFLTVSRSARRGAHDQGNLGFFRRLAPHVVNSLALRVQLEHLNTQPLEIASQQRGMFFLDSQWRWIGGNPVAEQMVSAGWWRGRLMSPLEPRHSTTRSDWRSMQAKLRSGTAQEILAIRDAKGVLVAFANVHVYRASSIGEHVPCYAVFVRPLFAADTRAVHAELIKIFGLTTAEAALALALRKHSDTSHAAASIGITEGSARTRLQVVYEKTATRRRSDLLLLIDALVETVA